MTTKNNPALLNTIMKALKDSPANCAMLAKQVHLRRDTVSQCLLELEVLGRIEVCRGQHARGTHFIAVEGMPLFAVPAQPEKPPRKENGQVAAERRIMVPAVQIGMRRDTLVAALFGAAIPQAAA